MHTVYTMAAPPPTRFSLSAFSSGGSIKKGDSRLFYDLAEVSFPGNVCHNDTLCLVGVAVGTGYTAFRQ